jgi:uncharacterized membrane protein YfcA
MDDIISTAAAVTAIFVLAGLVKGVVGLGLPTVAMGLLTLAVAPAQAAALLLAPSLVTNLWQAMAGPGLFRLAVRLWPMLAFSLLGTLAGIGSLAGANGASATAGLGLALVAYTLVALWAPRLRVPATAERWAGPLVGLTTGMVTGATGVFVVPAVPYLQALGLARDELVQALGLSFTVSTIGLGAALALHGTLPAGVVTASVLAVGPALLGMSLGQMLRSRVEPRTFRLCFLASLLLLGAWLAARGFLLPR